ncbi:MAG: 50S ribosomal protein L3 N(5)-glutamine methyltransferase [Rhodocyclaceae bacterium]|jgi:ribosomal protein L3 glutamine methyltransferase|nr:50S ribosomal protein L3 N(5)-glutamine methyltransferase [Rhodocyclaceae bacterium]
MNDIHHDHGHEPEHDQDDHVHEHGPLSELVTVRDWLRYAVSEFNRNKLFFGHGCSDAFDEAVWLVLHTLSLPLDRLEPFMDACVLGEEREALMHIIERRVKERIPAAYLTQEAWLGDYRFYVDERVIVPRSFFAELLEDGFAPWVQDPAQVQDALDLCTGSACLAILMAETFPDARVAAVDLSADALEVAHRNVAEYGLQERVELFQGDLFEPLGTRRFDLIITNPPYVTAQAMAALPPEYRHEPGLALGAGEDGLDVVRGILAGARQHLTEQGVLAVEIGHNRDIVEAAFPDLPFTWLSAEGGECVVFVLNACDLP